MSPETTTERERRRRKAAFALFALIQAAAAAFLIIDVTADLMSASADWGTYAEAVFAPCLCAGTVFSFFELRRSHDLLRSHETALASASGALAEVIEAQFAAWGLTPAERDVAMFALKGFDLAEIARLRGAAQGTVRAQMAAVYAKSGTSGRGQFAAFFVEDLLAGGVGASGFGDGSGAGEGIGAGSGEGPRESTRESIGVGPRGLAQAKRDAAE